MDTWTGLQHIHMVDVCCPWLWKLHGQRAMLGLRLSLPLWLGAHIVLSFWSKSAAAQLQGHARDFRSSAVQLTHTALDMLGSLL